MKKLSVLSLVLAVLMLVMMVPAMAADEVVYLKTGATRTDVLKDSTYVYDNTKEVFSSASTSINMINDDVIAAPSTTSKKVYLNKACFASASSANLVKENWNYTFAGRKYAYVIRFDLAKKATIDGFAIWATRDANNAMVYRQIDTEFDILVSKDNGQTWTVAWESVRAHTTTGTAYGLEETVVVIDKSAGFPKDKGGNFEFVTEGDYGYAKAAADFTAIPGVTNVMYACSGLRSDDSNDLEKDGNPYLKYAKGGYYPTRFSEFDFYGSFDPEEPAPATGDNTVVLTVAAATALFGAAYVCKKKLFD